MKSPHAFAFLIASTLSAAAQSTAFTYQGILNNGAGPATGSYDLRFALYDAPTDGNIVGVAVTNPATSVSNGLLTVQLDFGATAFDGAPRWLDIGVRSNGGVAAFTVLSPRQPITSAPYAVQAAHAAFAASAVGNFNGVGTNTAFYSTIGAGATTGVGSWKFLDGAAFGVPGQTLLYYSGETNTFIVFSGANGSAGIQWFRNHFNNSGIDPELTMYCSGSVALGVGQDSGPGNFQNDRALQIGIGYDHRAYSYQQRETLLWDGVDGHFGCLPIQFAPYFTNDNSGNQYTLGITPPSAINTQLPTLACYATDTFGRGEFAFFDYFNNGSPSATTWDLANSRKRLLVRIGTNIDTGGLTLYGRADMTNITSGTTKLWDWDGTNQRFYQTAIFTNAHVLVQNSSGGNVFEALVGGFNFVQVGDAAAATDFAVKSASDYYMAAGPSGNFYSNLRVGGTKTAPSQALEVIGTAGISAGLVVTNLTAFLNADATSTSTSFGNLTFNNSISVVAANKYRFTLTLFLDDSAAADGCKVDFNGGSVATTNFRAHGQLVNDTGGVVTLGAAASTSLAGVINATAMTTMNQHELRIDGTWEPSGTGTFIPRFAQNTHSTGTLTIRRGSNLVFTQCP